MHGRRLVRLLAAGLIAAAGCLPAIPPADHWPQPQDFLPAAADPGPAGVVREVPAGATFHRDVAPVLHARCVECHRPGQVAPFPLLTYPDARRRARQIADVVGRRVMPPWKPVPGIGEFHDARVLSEAEIALLRRWADAGAPEGDPADAPAPPRFADGWRLGTPDLVLTMPKPFTVPPEGPDVHRNFVIPVELPADRYVRAVEFRPGNPKVAHHAIVLLDTGGRARRLEDRHGGPGAGYPATGGPGFLPSGGLPGWVPGEAPRPFPADAAVLLPRRVDVVLSMHYHPSGRPEPDQSSIALYFTDVPPRRTPGVLLMGVLNLRIAAGDRSHTTTTCYELPVDVEVTGIGPHMHLIGRDVWMWAEPPAGPAIPLIWIRDWDFNWQGTYRPAKPLRLPRGTRIWGQWTHDNSAANPANPHVPPREIRNGGNSTDEMAGAWIYVILDRPEDSRRLWGETIRRLLRAAFTAPFRVEPPARR